MPNRAWLERLKALEKAATPGPWHFWDAKAMAGRTILLRAEQAHFLTDSIARCQACADMDFAVSARNSSPDLLSLIEALLEERRQVPAAGWNASTEYVAAYTRTDAILARLEKENYDR